MKLPPLPGPWKNNTAPPQPLLTDLGFPVVVRDGSVFRCDVMPYQKLCHGEQAAEFLEQNCRDAYRVYWLASECRRVRVESGYQHQTAIANERKRAKGKFRSKESRE